MDKSDESFVLIIKNEPCTHALLSRETMLPEHHWGNTPILGEELVGLGNVSLSPIIHVHCSS